MSGPLDPGRARTVLGVAIGRSGALALLTRAGDLVFVADMPTLDDLKAWWRRTWPTLFLIFFTSPDMTLARNHLGWFAC